MPFIVEQSKRKMSGRRPEIFFLVLYSVKMENASFAPPIAPPTRDKIMGGAKYIACPPWF
jgi:hypothetical protein